VDGQGAAGYTGLGAQAESDEPSENQKNQNALFRGARRGSSAAAAKIINRAFSIERIASSNQWLE
jgi:hypothetical protein